MQIAIKKSEKRKQLPHDNEIGFGSVFTDHMFNMDYDSKKGWYNPRIEPYNAFLMDPATIVLHYGQSVFEGLKAYRTSSGNIQLFRPKDNFERMNRSCRSVCIPAFDQEFLLEVLKKLLSLEEKWVPHTPGTSLYIRPTVIATDCFLGVKASDSYRFFIILSPVGAYYSEGFNPIKIWVTKNHVRAVRGGIGEAKTAANYAASLFAGEEAKDNGYEQVLWLDGIEKKYIEEIGSTNIFFVIDDEVITPELNGSILKGITRDSVINLAKNLGMKVSERKISIAEVLETHQSGKLQEIFGSGTAAVISPIGELRYDNSVIKIGNGVVGPVTKRIYQTLTDIQYGNIEDTFGWIETI
ncbi:branched-chain amino acid aminotransferase [Thermodesulfobacteriota bacterium]